MVYVFIIKRNKNGIIIFPKKKMCFFLKLIKRQVTHALQKGD